MSTKLRQICKIALSVFIVLQVITVLILPNPESIFYRNFRQIFVSYGNLLGFNTTWRFFSPNPLVRLMEYEAFSRNSDGELQGHQYRYPKTLHEEVYREIFNRKLNNAMFLSMRPEAFLETLGLKFCQWHPEAQDIAVYLRGRESSGIEKSKMLNVKTIEDLGPVTRSHLLDVHCRGDEDTP